MVNTSTPLPTFAVVVDCGPHTYRVRFFRDLEAVPRGDLPYDAFIPLLPYRGGRLSGHTTRFTLTVDEQHHFEIWDGLPVKI